MNEMLLNPCFIQYRGYLSKKEERIKREDFISIGFFKLVAP